MRAHSANANWPLVKPARSNISVTSSLTKFSSSISSTFATSSSRTRTNLAPDSFVSTEASTNGRIGPFAALTCRIGNSQLFTAVFETTITTRGTTNLKRVMIENEAVIILPILPILVLRSPQLYEPRVCQPSSRHALRGPIAVGRVTLPFYQDLPSIG